MQINYTDAADTNHGYVDVDGDVWLYDHNTQSWRYTVGEGVFTKWDDYARIPEKYSPLTEMSIAATQTIRKAIQ